MSLSRSFASGRQCRAGGLFALISSVRNACAALLQLTGIELVRRTPQPASPSVSATPPQHAAHKVTGVSFRPVGVAPGVSSGSSEVYPKGGLSFGTGKHRTSFKKRVVFWRVSQPRGVDAIGLRVASLQPPYRRWCCRQLLAAGYRLRPQDTPFAQRSLGKEDEM